MKKYRPLLVATVFMLAVMIFVGISSSYSANFILDGQIFPTRYDFNLFKAFSLTYENLAYAFVIGGILSFLITKTYIKLLAICFLNLFPKIFFAIICRGQFELQELLINILISVAAYFIVAFVTKIIRRKYQLLKL